MHTTTTLVSTLALLLPLTLSTPTAPVNAPATPTPTTLRNDLGTLFASLADSPGIDSLFASLLAAVETDALNYAIANPSLVLAQLPALIDIFNPIVSNEAYFPTLVAAETAVGSALVSIVSADAANPTALAGDILGLVEQLVVNPTFASLYAAIGSTIPTDARSFVLASPSAVLADLPLILSDVNPIFATESFYPRLTSLESQVLSALSGLVASDVPTATATVSGMGITTAPTAPVGTGIPFTSRAVNGTSTKAATMTINTFKGDAATGGVAAMTGLVGVVGLVVALL